MFRRVVAAMVVFGAVGLVGCTGTPISQPGYPGEWAVGHLEYQQTDGNDGEGAIAIHFTEFLGVSPPFVLGNNWGGSFETGPGFTGLHGHWEIDVADTNAGSIPPPPANQGLVTITSPTLTLLAGSGMSKTTLPTTQCGAEPAVFFQGASQPGSTSTEVIFTLALCGQQWYDRIPTF